MVDKKLLEILQCTECEGDLEDKGNELRCKNCGKKYEIIDGKIINMLE